MPVPDDVEARIAAALDRAAAAAAPGHRARAPGAWLSRAECLVWDCRTPVPPERVFCHSHLEGLRDGSINECPGCAHAKESWTDLCAECSTDPAVRSSTSRPNTWYRPDYVILSERQSKD